MEPPKYLTVAERADLREAFLRLIPRSDLTARAVYEHFFELAPQVRPLFSESMVDQWEKVVGMLALMVDALDMPERFEHICRRAGIAHRAYKVKVDHFPSLRTALLRAIRETSEVLPSQEELNLWGRLYDIIAFYMIDEIRKAGEPAN